MFAFPSPEPDTPAEPAAPEPESRPKFKNAYQQPSLTYDGETNYSTLEDILEQEKQHNKTEAWNKLDKTLKIQKLHAFAEKHGRDHGLPVKEIKNLKAFFLESLDRGKLQRTKDVMYSKEAREISAIPALHFNGDTRTFTLRNLDTKRVSTMKSLTPKIRAQDKDPAAIAGVCEPAPAPVPGANPN